MKKSSKKKKKEVKIKNGVKAVEYVLPSAPRRYWKWVTMARLSGPTPKIVLIVVFAN